jgi:hypothetical protein
MRLVSLCLVLSSSWALASGPSWPIEPRVTWPGKVAAEGGTAQVDIGVSDDATDVRVEVFGSDGLTIDPSNKLSLVIAALPRGQHFVFEVGFHPAKGRASIVVQTRAKFAHTSEGGTVREFQFGAESPEQVAERSRCVRQDSDGTWVRVMGCDEATAPVAPLKGKMPGVSTIDGYVVGAYTCPPCPAGAMCKPCLMASAIVVGPKPDMGPVSPRSPPAGAKTVLTETPSAYTQGTKYRFEVRELPNRALTLLKAEPLP